MKIEGCAPLVGVPIEKNGGFMHITCSSCHKHVCWSCKTNVFDTENESPSRQLQWRSIRHQKYFDFKYLVVWYLKNNCYYEEIIKSSAS